MAWFFPSKHFVESRLQSLRDSLYQELRQEISVVAFSSEDRISQDIQNLHGWIQFLQSQNTNLSDEISNANTRLNLVPKFTGLDADQVRHIVDGAVAQSVVKEVETHISRALIPVNEKLSHLSSEVIEISSNLSGVEHLRARIDVVEKKYSSLERLRDELQGIRTSIVPGSASSSHLAEAVVKRIRRHGKTYVKQVLRNLVRNHGRIGALQIRELVVDQQRLCSKSSCYRLLLELEQSGELQVVSDGKEKLYVYLLKENTATQI